MKKIITITLLYLLMISCSKETITNQGIVGIWHDTYSHKSILNGVTTYYDNIIFEFKSDSTYTIKNGRPYEIPNFGKWSYTPNDSKIVFKPDPSFDGQLYDSTSMSFKPYIRTYNFDSITVNATSLIAYYNYWGAPIKTNQPIIIREYRTFERIE
jgi:hypothetical protein